MKSKYDYTDLATKQLKTLHHSINATLKGRNKD